MSRTNFGLLLAAGLVVLFALLLMIRPSEPRSFPLGRANVTRGDAQEEVGQRWLKPPGTEQGYAGDDACRKCHAREFDEHARSPHGRTVARIEGARPEFLSKQRVEDPGRGITYSVSTQNGTCEIAATTSGGRAHTRPDWVFGSGTQAHTYLGLEEGRFLESRISYYSRWREWGFTPGQGPNHDPDHPAGRWYSTLAAASCFGCHSTVLVGTSEALDLDRSHLNVGCEACHGPARKHVDAATALQAREASGTALAVPSPIRGERVIQVCGACHRYPESEPGEPIEEAELARLSGIALGRSRCFRESAGSLTCVTCHDPHAPLSTGPKSYDRACLGCHTAPAQTCSLGRTDRCARCHMAGPAAGRRLPLELHNHQIRIPPSNPAASNLLQETAPFVSEKS
jgi:hypothetical protein